MHKVCSQTVNLCEPRSIRGGGAMKYIQRECKNHGITDFVLEGRGYYRCKKCRTEAVQRRRDKLKEKAVDFLGGKCCRCGYNTCITALEFHHEDPTQKEFGIAASGATRSWENLKKELTKCILVCANCHREIHYLEDKN